METILETRGLNKTLRLRKAGNGNFVVEDWDMRNEIWTPVFENEEFQPTLHVYIDEICARANLQVGLMKKD